MSDSLHTGTLPLAAAVANPLSVADLMGASVPSFGKTPVTWREAESSIQDVFVSGPAEGSVSRRWLGKSPMNFSLNFPFGTAPEELLLNDGPYTPYIV
jgi:hypothetical protein